MKKLIAALLIVLMSALIVARIAFADGVPPGVTPTIALLDLRGQEVMHWIWTFEVDGATCVFVDGELDCFCSCAEDCNQPPITPTDKPPTDTPPTEVPPTSTPPIPEPTEKPKCNQGRGNSDDSCSPGNSDNNHGPNDSQDENRE